MTPEAPSRTSITGVILAGGQGRRMGGQDKGRLLCAGRPLVEWAITALAPQVSTLLISANRHLDQYRAYGYPVITDQEQEFQGPLAGILSAMTAARSHWLLTLPCDDPRPPPDLGVRLAWALTDQNAKLAIATAGGNPQPLYSLLPVTLAGSLSRFLASGERKVVLWHVHHRVALADFSDCPDCFANLNAPDDLRRIERQLLTAQPGLE